MLGVSFQAYEELEARLKAMRDLLEKAEQDRAGVWSALAATEDELRKVSEERDELKADAVRFNIHLEQKDRALKANAEEYRRLQAAHKKIAIDFYYWWHNQPGTNTEQGFDDWWAGREATK